MNPDAITEPTCNATKAQFAPPEALIDHEPARAPAENPNQQPHGGY